MRIPETMVRSILAFMSATVNIMQSRAILKMEGICTGIFSWALATPSCKLNVFLAYQTRLTGAHVVFGAPTDYSSGHSM